MPKRGTLLTDIEKGRIIGMRDSGKTVIEISKQLKRTYMCVNKYLKREGDYRHGGGPAKKLSESMKRHLVRRMSGESHVSLQKNSHTATRTCRKRHSEDFSENRRL